jgi:UDP-2,3-diacylglucosamine hydrolase
MRALFISDLHLSESDPITSDRFFTFMERIAPQADALYVLGDLFHVWLGDALIPHDEFAQKTVRAFAQFSGTLKPLYFILGNRDFMLGARFARACGGKFIPEQSVITLGGERAVVLHGDELCTDDKRYQRARSILRSRAFKAFGNALPFWLRRRIAARIRAASKSHKANATMQIMDANRDAINATFERHHVALMIHGHTHRPTDEWIDTPTGRKRRIVLSDWQQNYGYLEWQDGEFHVRPWP